MSKSKQFDVTIDEAGNEQRTESTNGVKKTRTPRSSDSITKGLLSLPLVERVSILNQLKSSIEEEVETLQAAAEQAKKIANGI